MVILDHIRESAENGDVKSMGITSSDAALLGLQQAAGKETGTGNMGKEGSEPNKKEAIKEILVTFGKHRPPDRLCFQQLPIPLLPLNTYPKMRAMPSFTSKPTDWMRPPAFPTAEISVGELHFSVLLMNYGTRGYNFCFYPKLLFKKAFDITKKSQY